MLHVIRSSEAPAGDGRYERDQYDDEHATYLVLADPGGRHLGSARLLRTDRAHILGSLYPELCAGEVPAGAAIREITRFCLDRRLSAIERRRVRDTLVTALADVALEEGIAAYSAIAELGWCRQILDFGWRCRELGPARRYGDALLAALRIDIDAETPALLRAAGVAPSPGLASDYCEAA